VDAFRDIIGQAILQCLFRSGIGDEGGQCRPVVPGRGLCVARLGGRDLGAVIRHGQPPLGAPPAPPPPDPPPEPPPPEPLPYPPPDDPPPGSSSDLGLSVQTRSTARLELLLSSRVAPRPLMRSCGFATIAAMLPALAPLGCQVPLRV